MKQNLACVYGARCASYLIFILSTFLVFFFSAAHAASAIPPTENIYYIAEHLVEAAQDARYFALPWTTAAAPQDEWRPVVSVAGADFGSELASARGGLLTVGFERRWSASKSYSLLAFYDSFNVYGDSSENVLIAGPIKNPPLDIPEHAIFSNPGGKFTHGGIGLVVRHNGNNPSENGWATMWGVLLERLALSDYRIDYRLTTGADAGAKGSLEYSGTNYFVTPFYGGQYHYDLGSQYSLLPRVAMGVPLPTGKITTRMTGPGFNLTDESTGGEQIRVGDGYLVLGVGLRDENTHLELDLGSVVTFPLIERLTHEGINSGVMLSVTWRGAG